MTPEDAEAIGVFVADMIHAETNAERQTLVEWLKKHFGGTPGSGTCMCPRSPDSLKRDCDRWIETLETTKAAMQLDHRCPWHGEKAQPKLWGRHKEKVLTVTGKEWLSLGVEYGQS